MATAGLINLDLFYHVVHVLFNRYIDTYAKLHFYQFDLYSMRVVNFGHYFPPKKYTSTCTRVGYYDGVRITKVENLSFN